MGPCLGSIGTQLRITTSKKLDGLLNLTRYTQVAHLNRNGLHGFKISQVCFMVKPNDTEFTNDTGEGPE